MSQLRLKFIAKGMDYETKLTCKDIQGSAKRWYLGCVNAAGKAGAEARAIIKFTKPGERLLAGHCTEISYSSSCFEASVSG